MFFRPPKLTSCDHRIYLAERKYKGDWVYESVHRWEAG